MIIFESILTNLSAIVIFRGGWGSNKNWLKIKIEQPQANLDFRNR
jgi:hypothetical protein